jgi:3-phenylpropionate/trans-cinnamate dioxygenase ferredoxin subunit
MEWKVLSTEIREAIEQLQLHQLTRIIVDGRMICVTRLEDGFFGIQNSCPHAGAQLHHGHCNRRGIVGCPLHGYKFDIKTGKSADGNNYKIKHYTFKQEEDKLLIGV